jgi:enamine deaminase RidA (YjgF/YER057c/UK114 family)
MSTKRSITISYEASVRELGYEIELGNDDAGKIMRAVRVGNLVFTSGQVSAFGGKEIYGRLGAELTVEQGYEAAQLSGLACLHAVKSVVGSLDNVVRVVKLLGMVNVAPGFYDTPGVIHGVTDLMRAVFGDAGKHARSAVGMTLPLNYATEVEAIFEVKP